MAESASAKTGIAGRYATALFDLASETGQLDAVESDLAQVAEALESSADLRGVVESPIHSRAEQGTALAAVMDAMGVSDLTKNVVGVMASKRRLFTLADVCAEFARMMAASRGEISAEVTSAQPLSDAQRATLAEKLKAAMGRDVKLETAVDESLIGGLVVKVGSKLIDTSIRAKLVGLQNAMREVG